MYGMQLLFKHIMFQKCLNSWDANKWMFIIVHILKIFNNQPKTQQKSQVAKVICTEYC